MPRAKPADRKPRLRKPGSAPEIRFTAEEIVLRKVEELVHFPNNPKIHSVQQIDAISANILALGFDQPILIDETDTILKGHGRHLAARKGRPRSGPDDQAQGTIRRSEVGRGDQRQRAACDDRIR